MLLPHQCPPFLEAKVKDFTSHSSKKTVTIEDSCEESRQTLQMDTSASGCFPEAFDDTCLCTIIARECAERAHQQPAQPCNSFVTQFSLLCAITSWPATFSCKSNSNFVDTCAIRRLCLLPTRGKADQPCRCMPPIVSHPHSNHRQCLTPFSLHGSCGMQGNLPLKLPLLMRARLVISAVHLPRKTCGSRMACNSVLHHLLS